MKPRKPNKYPRNVVAPIDPDEPAPEAQSSKPAHQPRFAKKALGQNFLVDKIAIAKITAAIPEGTPLLLEIGPGRGALSTTLHTRAQKFCVLEKDDLFADQIGATLFVHGSRSHHVFHADALEFDWEKIWSETSTPENTQLSIAANLPYNVATEILFRLLALAPRIPRMVLMFQKEVGQRIAAQPNSKAYGAISLATQNLYDVKIQQILKPGAFRPSPKVDSIVLEFTRLPEPRVRAADQNQFFQLIKAAFSHRRKTLENSLSLELYRLPWVQPHEKTSIQKALARTQIDPKRRAETLSLEDFGRLYASLHTALSR